MSGRANLAASARRVSSSAHGFHEDTQDRGKRARISIPGRYAALVLREVAVCTFSVCGALLGGVHADADDLGTVRKEALESDAPSLAAGGTATSTVRSR